MNQYYTLSKREKKPSLIERLFRKRRVKPIVRTTVSKVDPKEFYKKYGIIYNGSIEGSCVNSLF